MACSALPNIIVNYILLVVVALNFVLLNSQAVVRVNPLVTHAHMIPAFITATVSSSLSSLSLIVQSGMYMEVFVVLYL